MSELTSDQNAEIAMLEGLLDVMRMADFLVEHRPDLASDILTSTANTLAQHIVEMKALYVANNRAVTVIEKRYAERAREKTPISLSQVRKWK